MGGIFSNQVPEPDERMQHMIEMLKHEDNSGVLDFSEYVEALGKFCLLNKEDVLKLCFNVFDDDKNGTIEGEELENLLEMLHEDEQTSNMKHALNNFDFNGDGKIDFAEFKQLNAKFPSLFYPAYRIQQNMKNFTLGEKWWERKIEDLITEHNNKLAQHNDMSIEMQLVKEREKKIYAEQERQKVARERMGCMYYTCCPCRRKSYTTDRQEASDSDGEIEREKPKHEVVVKKNRKDGRKQIIVSVGPRKPLTHEERLERARKRRLRDMQDRPTRKD